MNACARSLAEAGAFSSSSSSGGGVDESGRAARHASGSSLGAFGSVSGLVGLVVAMRRATPAPGRRAKFWREAAGRARRAPTGGRATRTAAWRSITSESLM